MLRARGEVRERGRGRERLLRMILRGIGMRRVGGGTVSELTLQRTERWMKRSVLLMR